MPTMLPLGSTTGAALTPAATKSSAASNTVASDGSERTWVDMISSTRMGSPRSDHARIELHQAGAALALDQKGELTQINVAAARQRLIVGLAGGRSPCLTRTPSSGWIRTKLTHSAFRPSTWSASGSAPIALFAKFTTRQAPSAAVTC